MIFPLLTIYTLPLSGDIFAPQSIFASIFFLGLSRFTSPNLQTVVISAETKPSETKKGNSKQEEKKRDFFPFFFLSFMGKADFTLLDLVEKVGSWVRVFTAKSATSSCHECPNLLPTPTDFHGAIPDTPLADSSDFSSPRSLCSRSDEEDYFTPSAASDLDTVSISTNTNNEVYSNKYVNSSPLDSPTTTTGEASGYFRKAGAEVAGDPLEQSGYDNLSVYRNHETRKVQRVLDFENNRLIWDPPRPEDENDDLETEFFGCGNEGDDAFSSGSFSREGLGVREKASDANKEGLRDAVHGHFMVLVAQLLKAEGIVSGGDGDGWLDIVSSLAWQAATFVKLDTSKGGIMDPGSYVKVKCIASGKPSHSTFVKGVVCTKNVTHKRMISQHKNPRLFLLGGALEYHKVPNKLASINTLIEQESDHLKVSVSKIDALRPNVLLVEKSVSSYAQQYLRTNEISVVLNVKKALLERIARCTGAQIGPSIDDFGLARLGHCEMFRVEKFFEDCPSSYHPNNKSCKTLMFFEGCPRQLGCTVLLRGTNREELRKVKHVVQYASFAAYHLSRETSFLADEGATLPKVSSDPDINCGDMPRSSPAHSELGGHYSIGPKECCELPYSPKTKRVPHRKEVGYTFEDERKLCGQLRKANEQEKTYRNGGNETPREYFSTADNQSILVSLSITSIIKGTMCTPSHLLRIKFYGSSDKPLGRYLCDDLFDQATCCRSCKEPAENHVRCYTHQHGSLALSVQRHPSIKLPGERDGRIWMWHRCLKCEHKDGVPPAARRVVMSDAAWGLSFGKFLELSFSNHVTADRVASCGHSLQKDCLRFYGFGSMIAFFRYGPVDILSIQLPPLLLDFASQAQEEWARREADTISKKMKFMHFEVFNALQRIEQKTTASENESIKTTIHNRIVELKDLLKKKRDQYDVLLQLSVSEDSPSLHGPLDIFELNRLRRCILIDCHAWDRRLCCLDLLSNSRSSTLNPNLQVGKAVADSNREEWRAGSISNNVRFRNSAEGILTKSLTMSRRYEECNSNDLIKMEWSIQAAEGYMALTAPRLVPGDCYLEDGEATEGGEACIRTALERLPSAVPTLPDKIDSLWSGNPEAEAVTSISLMQIDPPYRKVIFPVRVNSFDSALRLQDRLQRRLSPTSSHLSSVRSFNNSGGLAHINYPQISSSSVKILNRNPVFISSTTYMMDEGARLLLPQNGLDDLVVVLYDTEPTTIISYAISSKEYADFIATKLDQDKGLFKSARINSFARPLVSQFRSDDEPQHVRSNFFLDSKETHFRISFDDDSSIPSDKVKFSVTCYFAKQFDELRKKCCPSEADFLRSMSRCKRWNAQGGKSNVYFAKTLDERFIVKQVPKTELESFEDFAAEYFNYLTESINSGNPTCLAKIFGIYQVTVRHLQGGREMKMDLMVMENLFFGRKLSRVYDLKGSSRSRYNPNTSRDDEVLLDLNLLEALQTKPIFLGSKAKRSLERAIWNDTSFLASVDVMDYSLLVGVDGARKELVIGIIDFMRQYTWDKHLETWVKASGILGGSKNDSPTVVSPLQYKKRFRKAMSRYFLTLPDQRSAS